MVAGWGHSALVTATGHVYTAGRNVQGQLGLGPLEGFPVNERGHRYDPYVAHPFFTLFSGLNRGPYVLWKQQLLSPTPHVSEPSRLQASSHPIPIATNPPVLHSLPPSFT